MGALASILGGEDLSRDLVLNRIGLCKRGGL